MAPKVPPVKSRGYKNTIHNVHREAAVAITSDWIKSQDTIWATLSPEPNPEDESRYHIHIFMAFKNQRQLTAMQKSIQKLRDEKGFCTPPPPGETRVWNNWWCRPMNIKDLKKTAKDCDDYLRGKTKNKPLGEVVTFKKRPCGRRVRMNRETKKYEEFCLYCSQSNCLGCCTGCDICTPTSGHYELIRRNIIINSEKYIKKSLKNNLVKVITPDPDDPYNYPKIEYL